MSAKIKMSMIYLGTANKTYTKDGVEKKSTNVKMMDSESDLYDFYVGQNNHNLLDNLTKLKQMQPVTVILEVGAYQLKPTVKLFNIEIAK